MVTHGALAEIVAAELSRIPSDDHEQAERILRVAFAVVEVDTYSQVVEAERKRNRLQRAAAAGQAPF